MGLRGRERKKEREGKFLHFYVTQSLSNSKIAYIPKSAENNLYVCHGLSNIIVPQLQRPDPDIHISTGLNSTVH